MTIEQWLGTTTQILKKADILTAELDAQLLLSDHLDKDRSWLHAHPDHILNENKLKKLDALIQRRSEHEPIAYIRGKQEFYGREFHVSKSVLVPRPESEQIIEEFLKLDLPRNAVVADVGCGSGALGITAKLERDDIQINLLDINKDVFIVAKKNARKYMIRAQFYTGDLLEAWPIEYDTLLCNLPYVPENYPINDAAKHEPGIALFSGLDGLDHYRRLFVQLTALPIGNPIVITEALPEQHEKLCKIARNSGYVQINQRDLVQVFSK